MQIKYFKTETRSFEIPAKEKCKVRAMQNEKPSNPCSF